MMVNTAVGGGQENVAKFLESLQADLKVLSSETKKKYPQIKEVNNKCVKSPRIPIRWFDFRLCRDLQSAFAYEFNAVVCLFILFYFLRDITDYTGEDISLDDNFFPHFLTLFKPETVWRWQLSKRAKFFFIRKYSSMIYITPYYSCVLSHTSCTVSKNVCYTGWIPNEDTVWSWLESRNKLSDGSEPIQSVFESLSLDFSQLHTTIEQPEVGCNRKTIGFRHYWTVWSWLQSRNNCFQTVLN